MFKQHVTHSPCNCRFFKKNLTPKRNYHNYNLWYINITAKSRIQAVCRFFTISCASKLKTCDAFTVARSWIYFISLINSHLVYDMVIKKQHKNLASNARAKEILHVLKSHKIRRWISEETLAICQHFFCVERKSCRQQFVIEK